MTRQKSPKVSQQAHSPPQVARQARSAKGRPPLSKQDQTAIRNRLRWYYQEHRQYKSQRELAQVAGLPESTISDWLSRRSRVPDLANLLTFARNEGISLDWLLLGQGSPSPGVARTTVDLADDLRNYVINELARGEWAGYERAIQSRLPLAPDLLAKVPEDYRSSAAAYIGAFQNMIIAGRHELLIDLLDSPTEGEEHAQARREWIAILKAQGRRLPIRSPKKDNSIDPDLALQNLPPEERQAAWERRRQSQERIIKHFSRR